MSSAKQRMEIAEKLLEKIWKDLSKAEDLIDSAIEPTMRHKFYAWAHDANINITKLKNVTLSDIYRMED